MSRRTLASLACGLALAIAAAFSPTAFAAGLAARLRLPDGEPAAGWVVTVVGRPISAPCGPDGRFVLDPAPEPPFVLVASGPNGEVSAPLEVAALPAGGAELTLPAALRDSLTVVSGIAPSLDSLPASAPIVLTQEELEQRAPQRLFQALDSIAGASKLGDGADSVPALRGLARGRTLILLDGARVTAERRAGPSATFIDPASLASVDVLRGPGSVIYGSDAFGGVINAISRDPEPGRFHLRFGAEAATGGLDEQSGHVALSTDLGAGQLLVAGHVSDADDGEAGGGEEIFNSGYADRGGALRLVTDAGSGRLRLGLTVDRVEDLGKAAIDSRSIRSFYPEESSDRFTASWLGTPGGGWESLEAALFAGRYRIILHRDRVPTATSNRRIDISDVDADDAAVRAVGARPLAGGRLQVGLDIHSRFNLQALTGRVDFAGDAVTVSRTQTTVSIDEASQLTGGLFGTWTRDLGARFTLGLGLRGDQVKSENRGGFFGDRNESASAVSGNLALTAALAPGWTTSLQVARGFRSPTLSDRFFRGPSGRGFVTGNPDLDPETSLQLDLATRYRRGGTAVGIYAYRYEIDDLIERYSAGSDFFFRNRGQATIEGLEVEVQTRLGAAWSSEAGFAYARGETDGGASIDDIAAPNGWWTLRWSFGRGYAFGRVTSFLRHADPGPTELERPAFTVFDLGAGFRLSRHLELRASVRNLADRGYFASPDESADRAAGRVISIGFSGHF